MRDKLVEKLIKGEEKRQAEGLELIPSENYVSEDVLKANGSVFTNKYSEGYPGRRYYGGQDFTDQVERLAIERVCKLFKCKFANVQPHSGAPANLAVYAALLVPGDTVLGMDLSHGGHLTHGHPMTLPAKIYKFVTYKMKNPDTGEIDYEDMRRVALKEKPKLIIAGFSAYPRTLNYKKFVEIAHEVGAVTMADMAHIAGLIVAGVLRNPFDDGFDIITSTTHKTLRGPRGGIILTRENEEIAKKIVQYSSSCSTKELFFPQGVNVSLVFVFDEKIDETNSQLLTFSMLQRTFERGSGETLACGSGSCASVVASSYHILQDVNFRNKNVNCVDAKVFPPGGETRVRFSKEEGVLLSGIPKVSFRGEL